MLLFNGTKPRHANSQAEKQPSRVLYESLLDSVGETFNSS